MKATIKTIAFLLCLLTFVESARVRGKSKGGKAGLRRYSGKCKPSIVAEYELAFQGSWSRQTYPRMFPSYRPIAEWTKLVGRTHSDQYSMWMEGTQASASVKAFAEDGDTRGFDKEAQGYGGIRDVFTAAPIRGGMGKTATNFIADGSHTQVSFMVRLKPSPDWFVGISSVNLCERNKWKRFIKLDLYPIDAGTDRGLTFTSPDWPSVPQELVYKLSPNKPAHTASSFYYKNMTSLPPIAKVYLTKIAGYRRKGKDPIPLKEERNLVVYDESKSSDSPAEVIPKLEMIIGNAIEQSKNSMQNEIGSSATIHNDAGESGHCVVSEWTDWSPCSVTCGFGRQERRRTILKRSLTPGVYCPVLRDDRTCGGTNPCGFRSFQFLNRQA